MTTQLFDTLEAMTQDERVEIAQFLWWYYEIEPTATGKPVSAKPTVTEVMFDWTDEDKQELTNYLFERYAVGEHA